jgi:lipoate-protein ligase A
LLHQGTLLFGFNPAHASLYLQHPPKEPDYRQGRPHEQFLGNLPLAAELIRQRIASGWQALPGVIAPPLCVEDLVRGKYESPTWTERF